MHWKLKARNLFYDKRRSTTVRRAPFILAVYITIASLTQALRAEDFEGRLEALFGQYADIRTINLEVSRTETYNDRILEKDPKADEKRQESVIFRYKADQNKYRVYENCTTSKATEFLVTYDGARFEQLNYTSKTLSFRAVEVKDLAMFAPNPLYYPVQFMDRGEDGHFGQQIPLATLVDKAVIAETIARAKWRTSEQGPVAEFSAGVMNGRSTHFLVHFKQTPKFLPSKIERVGDDGKAIVSFEIVEYVPVKVGDAEIQRPLKTIRRNFREKGEVVVEEKTEIKVCEFNVPIDADEFSIDFKLADIVWDYDKHVQVKRPGSYRPPPIVSGINPNNSMPDDDGNAEKGVAIQTPAGTVGGDNVMSVAVIPKSPGKSGIWIGIALLCAGALAAGIGIVMRSRGKHS